MISGTLSVGLVLLSVLVASVTLANLASRHGARTCRHKHSDAAISFALDRLSWSDGRRFLRLYRSGAEDAIAARFPKWREYRDRFGKIEKDQKQ